MIPSPEPNVIGMLMWVGFIFIPVPFVLLAIKYNSKYVNHAMVAFIVFAVIGTGAMLSSPDVWEDYRNQVAEEIENASCTELVEEYKAYKDQKVKSQIADEYVIDCVATDEAMMLLEVMK